MRNFFTLVSGDEKIIIPATSGGKLLSDRSDVFLNIDDELRKRCADGTVPPSAETAVRVHEVLRDGSVSKMLERFTSDSRSLCLAQPQIAEFAILHPKWFNGGEYVGNFFLFELNAGIQLARISLLAGKGLALHVLRLQYQRIWDAVRCHRFILPDIC